MFKVHVKPKDRGLSLLIEDDEKLYEAKDGNGQEVVIVAKSEQESTSCASEHFRSVQFKLSEIDMGQSVYDFQGE